MALWRIYGLTPIRGEYQLRESGIPGLTSFDAARNFFGEERNKGKGVYGISFQEDLYRITGGETIKAVPEDFRYYLENKYMVSLFDRESHCLGVKFLWRTDSDAGAIARAEREEIRSLGEFGRIKHTGSGGSSVSAGLVKEIRVSGNGKLARLFLK